MTAGVCTLTAQVQWQLGRWERQSRPLGANDDAKEAIRWARQHALHWRELG